MALAQCKECGKQISIKTKKCPYCGASQSKKNRLVIAIVLVVFMGFLMASMSETPPSIESSQTATAMKEAPPTQIVPEEAPQQQSAPPLELTSLTCIPGESIAIVTGTVKNVSGKRMPAVSAVVSFYTEEGQFIKNEWTLIDLQPLMPGQDSSFSMMRQGNPAIANCEVKFNQGFSSVTHNVAAK